MRVSCGLPESIESDIKNFHYTKVEESNLMLEESG
jgi:hypothetical protein